MYKVFKLFGCKIEPAIEKCNEYDSNKSLISTAKLFSLKNMEVASHYSDRKSDIPLYVCVFLASCCFSAWVQKSIGVSADALINLLRVPLVRKSGAFPDHRLLRVPFSASKKMQIKLLVISGCSNFLLSRDER